VLISGIDEFEKSAVRNIFDLICLVKSKIKFRRSVEFRHTSKAARTDPKVLKDYKDFLIVTLLFSVIKVFIIFTPVDRE